MWLRRAGQALGFRAGVRLKHLALGQGMGARAAEAVEAGATRGLWVLLQNCPLLPRWLPALDALLEGLERPHKARPWPVRHRAGGSCVLCLILWC